MISITFAVRGVADVDVGIAVPGRGVDVMFVVRFSSGRRRWLHIVVQAFVGRVQECDNCVA